MGLRDLLFGSKKSKQPKQNVDFSNVRSGSSSTAPSAERAPLPGRERPGAPASLPQKTWTVRSGDSLSAIAQKVYGDANRWKTIYEANRSQIDDPDLIHPGQELVLPDLR